MSPIERENPIIRVPISWENPSTETPLLNGREVSDLNPVINRSSCLKGYRICGFICAAIAIAGIAALITGMVLDLKYEWFWMDHAGVEMGLFMGGFGVFIVGAMGTSIGCMSAKKTEPQAIEV
jgi:hypothetical protein